MQKLGSNLRIDSLDVARGTALIAMATYHFSWDLELFGFLPAGSATSGFLKYYARGIASSFLFIVGFSLVLSTLNGIKWRSFFIRLAQVAGAAFVISAATYYAVPDGWIFFGILHHIVAASLIGLIFLRLHWALVLIAAIAAFALPYLDVMKTEAQWLTFIGLYKIPPNSNDFVPLVPWLSASLLGIAFAKFIIAKNWLEAMAEPRGISTAARLLRFLGRHSLLFYIVHQPALIGLVWTIAQIVPPVQNVVGANFQSECKTVCGQQFNENQCENYCTCFENELNDNAALWSQLPDQDQSKAISLKCTQFMQENSKP